LSVPEPVLVSNQGLKEKVTETFQEEGTASKENLREALVFQPTLGRGELRGEALT